MPASGGVELAGERGGERVGAGLLGQGEGGVGQPGLVRRGGLGVVPPA